MSNSITCLGNDLDGVLAGIRERKCVPDRMECCVGGKNAAYRVSYFERVKTVPSTDSRPAGEMRDGDDGGARPAPRPVAVQR